MKKTINLNKIPFLILIILFTSSLGSQSSVKAQTVKEKYDNWHNQIFRKLFFDYHNHMDNWGLAENFDAEKWAEQLQAADVEGVSVFAKCAQGWRYYLKGDVGWVHPEMPPGLDMLGNVVNACHKRGIKAIAYYHTFGSKKLEELHPEWMGKNSKNEPRGLCMKTPLLEEHILPQIREIVRNYDIDGIFFDGTNIGMCYCNDCRKGFQNDTGFDIPLSKDSPQWLDHVKWLNKESSELRQKIMDAVHDEKPEVLVSFNWSYTPRQPEIVPDDVGFLTCDIFPDDQLFSGSYLGKYWATLGRSFDIMNSAFLRWWGDWGCKPAAAMQQECATIIANGGKTWLGYMMPAQFGVEPAVMEELGKTMKFVKEREEFCRNSEPVPYIAVLHSTHQLYTKEPTQRLDEKTLYSVHKMLMQGGFHYNILNEKTLLENLSDYKVVILPDQRYISEELADALEKFVRNGGGVIASVLTGSQDEAYKPTGKFILEDVLGVKLTGNYPYTNGYIVLNDKRLKDKVLDMPHQVWGEFTYVQPTTAGKLADLWDVYIRRDGEYYQSGSSPVGKNTGYPSITVNRYGKGKAVYISGDIFGAYTERNNWNLKNMFRNLVDMALPETLISIDAPDNVEVVLKKQENRTLVHLINHNGERSFNNTIAYTENIIPIFNIGVKVKVNTPPSSVKLMPENQVLTWNTLDNGAISITVPKLDIYSIVVIE
ncbi:MAG: alpha-L-fucosidase [Bacteroidales bacterium]